MTTTPRQNALDTIAALAHQHDLSIDDIGAVLARDYSRDKSGGVLVIILGYLGAVFIFGGLALFIGMQWDIFSSPARVVITYGSGLAAFIFAIITLRDARYRGASTPLFIAATALLPTGMFVFLHEYAKGDDAQLAGIIVFGLCAVQYLATFSIYRRTALLFFGFGFYTIALSMILERMDVPLDLIALSMSVSTLIVAWKIDQTEHRGIAAFWYFVAGFCFLASCYDYLSGPPYDVVLLAISVFMMFLSVRIRSRTLLLVNTVGLLCFLCYYTDKYFKDVVGWPVALMIMGAMLVGVSAWAVKLNRKIKS